jgi:hypothetical protein
MRLNASGADDSEATAEYQRQLAESYANNKSQLNVIFDVIGTPTERDLSHVEAPMAQVLRRLEGKTGKVRQSDECVYELVCDTYHIFLPPLSLPQ